jgi:hypothetical protein
MVPWHGIWNWVARIIRIGELTEPSFKKDTANSAHKKHGREANSSVSSNKDRNTDRKKSSSFRKTDNKKGRRVKVMRRTCTENTGILETSVTISMQDSGDSIDGDGNDDDDSTFGSREKKQETEESLLKPNLLMWTHRD